MKLSGSLTKSGRTRAVAAGLLLAGSLPPWGWWPLGILAFAVGSSLVESLRWTTRFRNGWLMSLCWLLPSTLWMWDMTPVGWVAAGMILATFNGLAFAACPPSRTSIITFPLLVAFAELVRSEVIPFGGIPLSTISMGQASSPLVWFAPTGGVPLVTATTVASGILVNRCTKLVRSHLKGKLNDRPSVAPLGVVASLIVIWMIGFWGSSGPIANLEIALVQGGGIQRTRAENTNPVEVFERHLELSKTVSADVDLIVWPENVVNPDNQDGLEDHYGALSELAIEKSALVSVGVFYPTKQHLNVNSQVLFEPTGLVGDEYHKVNAVPFGEYVPFRKLLGGLSSQFPARDLQSADNNATLRTSLGIVGTTISWEGFFPSRGRNSVENGALLLTNPTNGSSYWLTQVQTQQVASNQLQAVAYDRWVNQVGPTGLSAVINPRGRVVERSNISDAIALAATVELKSSKTIAARFGNWPLILAAIAAVATDRWRRYFGNKRLTQHTSPVR